MLIRALGTVFLKQEGVGKHEKSVSGQIVGSTSSLFLNVSG